MTDSMLDSEILSILAVQTDYGMSAELIAKYVLALTSEDVGSDKVLERLTFMKGRGWVDYQVDDYRKKLWNITDAGKVKRNQ